MVRYSSRFKSVAGGLEMGLGAAVWLLMRVWVRWASSAMLWGWVRRFLWFCPIGALVWRCSIVALCGRGWFWSQLATLRSCGLSRRCSVLCRRLRRCTGCSPRWTPSWSGLLRPRWAGCASGCCGAVAGRSDRGDVASAVGGVRQRVWPMMGIIPAVEGGLTLDVDASFRVVHSENKQGAAAGIRPGADCDGPHLLAST